MREEDIILLIERDEWMMDALRAVQSLNLPDWWIGAGFVRSKVWDYLHGYKKRTPLPDIDVIYFDRKEFARGKSKKFEKIHENALSKLIPSAKWTVTNQARMHLFHKRKPYNSSEEALGDWVETATCVGATLENGKVAISAPHGIEDLTGLVLRKTPNATNMEMFETRMKEKGWLKKWPKLKVVR